MFVLFLDSESGVVCGVEIDDAGVQFVNTEEHGLIAVFSNVACDYEVSVWNLIAIQPKE